MVPAESAVNDIVSDGMVGLPIAVTFCPSPNIGDEMGFAAGASGAVIGADPDGAGDVAAGVIASGEGRDAGGAGIMGAGLAAI